MSCNVRPSLSFIDEMDIKNIIIFSKYPIELSEDFQDLPCTREQTCEFVKWNVCLLHLVRPRQRQRHIIHWLWHNHFTFKTHRTFHHWRIQKHHEIPLTIVYINIRELVNSLQHPHTLNAQPNFTS
ncbi:hypothetical protein YC2023_124110 [Brassica napus]